MKKAFKYTLAAVALASVAGLVAALAQNSPSTAVLTQQWKASPHANEKSESFTHWDKDGKVPVPCATCHSGEGFRDFLGADASAPGRVDKPAAIRSVIGCNVCHNPQATALSRVTFPSGFVADKPGSSAVCMVCHQGRTSAASVVKVVANTELDTVDTKIRFVNIHYRAAAATLYGGLAKGGFEYPGKTYHGKFEHPPQVSTCSGCHDAHTTKVKTETCGTCHNNMPLRSIRTSKTDFDGDGNTSEGIHAELAALHAMLGEAVVVHAKMVARHSIAYQPAKYPYYFADLNGNGKVDTEEANMKNAYAHWTPRLLQAAYNYHYAAKEPGMYSHNPAYGLQLLYDSIESLNRKVGVPGFDKLKRP